MKYDWEHNSDLWIKAAHMQTGAFAGQSIGPIVFVIALPILTQISSFGNGSVFHGKPLIFWLISAAIGLVTAVMIFRRVRRNRIIIKRVPLLIARLCPKCLTALDKVIARDIHDEAPPPIQCPTCSESLNLTEVEDYWAIYPGVKGWFQPWRRELDLFSQAGKYDPNKLLAPAYRFQILEKLVSLIFILLFYLTFISTTVSGSLLVNAINHSSFLSFLLLFPLFGYTNYRRKGDSVHCLSCKYEKTLGTSNRCSECGGDWSWPFQCQRGESKKSYSLMAGGVVLILALLIGPLFLKYIGSGISPVRLLPTASLITQIAEGNGFLPDEWAAINSRTLSPDETNTLFLRLLDNRHRGYRFVFETDWYEKQVNSKAVSPDMIDRYFRESIRFNSHTPTFAAPGETINLIFQMHDEFIIQQNHTNHLLLEHIKINGQPAPNSRPDKLLTPHLLPRINSQTRKIRNYPCPIPLTLPDQPGPVTIKLIYWQIIAPMKPGIPAIQWNKDDTPILPPNAIWSKRIEKEFTITVK